MPQQRRERFAALAEGLALGSPDAAAAWAPEVLDIGFGHGESLLEAAARWPDRRVLGVEVHQPGILRAMERLAARAADRVAEDPTAGNARVLHGDVTALLPLLAPGTVVAVRAYFPDPWPKRRHAVRRLLDREVVAAVAGLLAPGGTFHVVTDDATYAAGVGLAAAAEPRLVPLPGGLGVPPTKYARRAAEAGRDIHDLAWAR